MSYPGGTVTPSGGSSLYFHIFGDQDGDQILPFNLVEDRYRRLGQTGAGVQILGYEAPDCRVSAHYLTTSLGDAIVKRTAIMLYPGSAVVSDSLGSTWNVIIKRPCTAKIHTGKYAFGGTVYPYRVSALMTMESQS